MRLLPSAVLVFHRDQHSEVVEDVPLRVRGTPGGERGQKSPFRVDAHWMVATQRRAWSLKECQKD